MKNTNIIRKSLVNMINNGYSLDQVFDFAYQVALTVDTYDLCDVLNESHAKFIAGEIDLDQLLNILANPTTVNINWFNHKYMHNIFGIYIIRLAKLLTIDTNKLVNNCITLAEAQGTCMTEYVKKVFKKYKNKQIRKTELINLLLLLTYSPTEFGNDYLAAYAYHNNVHAILI